MRLSDLAAVLEALIPDDEVSTERMLLVMSRLRCAGRVIVLDTSHDAFARLAADLDTSPTALEHAFHQAPDQDRERVRRAVTRPEHQGCIHLRDQLGRRPHAAALLEAFLSACWYGWPGLRLQVAEAPEGRCCCGQDLEPQSLRPSRSPAHHPMSAIDI